MYTLIHNRYRAALVLLMLVFMVIFSAYGIHRLYTFNSNYFDLGIMDQVVHNTAHGRFLEMTNQDLHRNTSRLAIHFDPILALFAPLYSIYQGPEVLIVGQVVVVGMGALAVFLLARKMLKSDMAGLLFAASYLLFYPIQRAVLFDFHSVVLATSFILFLIYFIESKRYVFASICLILALLTKENVGLVTFMLGAYYVFVRKERRFSPYMMAASVIAFVATVFMIIPYFRQNSHFALKYYGEFGDSPGRIILGIFEQPLLTAQKVLTVEALMYLGSLLLSHGLFIVFAPIEFLISLSDLLINLLSANQNMRGIYFHYNALIVPFIFLSAIVGYGRIRTKFGPASVKYVVALMVLAHAVSIYQYNPVPLSWVKEPAYRDTIDYSKLATVKEWSQKLGYEVKVSSTPRLAPFFTGRHYYYDFLFDSAFYGLGMSEDDIIRSVGNYEQADYVVIAKSELNHENKVLQTFFDHLRTNKKYQEVENKGDIQVFKRISN